MSTEGKTTEVQANTDEAREIIVPLLAEEIEVSKRRVETGKVRVSRVTKQQETEVNEMLARERVEVDRIPIGKEVASIPSVREEGDTIIIPVVEETLVIERRLVLKEELHIRRLRTTEPHKERVTLRKQEAVITRLPVEEVKSAGNSGD